MTRLLSSRFVAAVAFAAAIGGAATAAHAGGNVQFSIGVQVPGPVYTYPAPVYGRPAPVYVQPAPVYVQPRPVYVQPRPVYVQPAPVYMPPPAYYYRDGRGWGHRDWHPHRPGWDRGRGGRD